MEQNLKHAISIQVIIVVCLQSTWCWKYFYLTSTIMSFSLLFTTNINIAKDPLYQKHIIWSYNSIRQLKITPQTLIFLCIYIYDIIKVAKNSNIKFDLSTLVLIISSISNLLSKDQLKQEFKLMIGAPRFVYMLPSPFSWDLRVYWSLKFGCKIGQLIPDIKWSAIKRKDGWNSNS